MLYKNQKNKKIQLTRKEERMDQKPQPKTQANQGNNTPDIPASSQPYATNPGNYNRESGQKTLFFVGSLIAIVTILSIVSLLMINKKSNVLIQSNTIEKSITPVPTSLV